MVNRKMVIQDEDIKYAKIVRDMLNVETLDRLRVIDECEGSRDEYLSDNYCTIYDTCEECPYYQNAHKKSKQRGNKK